jgi:hypothetical protein
VVAGRFIGNRHRDTDIAVRAVVVKVFCPFRTQWSPSRRATVCVPPASLQLQVRSDSMRRSFLPSPGARRNGAVALRYRCYRCGRCTANCAPRQRFRWSIDTRQLFNDCHVLGIPKAGATIFLWNEDTQETQFTELFQGVDRKV